MRHQSEIKIKNILNKFGLGFTSLFFIISIILFLYAILYMVIPSNIFLIFCAFDVLISIILLREFIHAFFNYKITQ